MSSARRRVSETALPLREWFAARWGLWGERSCVLAAGWAAGRGGFGRLKPFLLTLVEKNLIGDVKWGEMGGIPGLTFSVNCEINLKIWGYSSFWLLTNPSRERGSRENSYPLPHNHINQVTRSVPDSAGSGLTQTSKQKRRTRPLSWKVDMIV